MLIEKHGDPAKAVIDPKRLDYRFYCDNCGCVFVESGAECEIVPLRDCTGRIAEMFVHCRCPNCREIQTGERK